MILKESINDFVISRCKVWCGVVLVDELDFFGFFLRSMVTHLSMSQNISVAKSFGESWRKLTSCGGYCGRIDSIASVAFW